MAILSLMARLGSSDPVELRASVDEVVAGFRLGSFGASPTKFDADDLWPLTARVLAARPFAEVADKVAAAGVPAPLAEAFWLALRDNITTLDDLGPWWRILSEGGAGVAAPEDAEVAQVALGLLPDPPYDAGTWSVWSEAVKAATGRRGKALFLPLRRIVTGRDAGPDMGALMPLVQVRPRLA
jgi:glutamyl-tRNA synthetase